MGYGGCVRLGLGEISSPNNDLAHPPRAYSAEYVEGQFSEVRYPLATPSYGKDRPFE